MPFITGFDRRQTALFPQAIDQLIDSNNPGRLIDVFVDNLKTVDFGCKGAGKNINGMPPFNPADLLKRHIYGLIESAPREF